MLPRMLAALLLPAITRYGFPPPGSISSFPVVFPCAIDGEFDASTAMDTRDSVNLVKQVNTVPQCASLLTRQVNTASWEASLLVVASNASHEAIPPLWQTLPSTSPTQIVAMHACMHPLVRSNYRDVGRPPDPGVTFLLNTSMVERFLQELLIYLAFEILRRPLSLYDAIALVCQLWLGISATLLWFFTYCANITYFVMVCTLVQAFRVMFMCSVAVTMALGVVCRGVVNLTRALGDSIAGLALYMCGLTVAHSASALIYLASAVSRSTLSLVYAVTLPMRRMSTMMRERLVSLSGGDSLELPLCKKRRRKASFSSPPQ